VPHADLTLEKPSSGETAEIGYRIEVFSRSDEGGIIRRPELI
jgi:hypothetical protein